MKRSPRNSIGFFSAAIFLYLAVRLAGLVMAALPSTVQFESTITNVTPSGLNGVFPYVTTDAVGKSHIIFLNQVGTTTGSDIRYTNNLAGSFAAATPLQTAITQVSRPSILAYADKVYAAYTVNNQQLYIRPGVVTGTLITWGSPELVNDATGTFDGRMAADTNGNIHIVWLDSRCGTANIQHRTRFANGTYSLTSGIMPDCKFQNKAMVTVTNDGTAHVAMIYTAVSPNGEIYYARPSGSGWATQNLSNTPASISNNPTIATDGTNLFVAWDDDSASGVHSIFLRISTDGGATWRPPAIVSVPTQFSAFPHLAWASAVGRMYLIWSGQDPTSNKSDIMFRELDSAGNMTDPINLTCTATSSDLGRISVGGSTAQIVWQENNNQTMTLGGQVGNGLSTTSCALAPTSGPVPTAGPSPTFGPSPTPSTVPTDTPLPTYTPIPTDTTAPTATPACTNCFFGSIPRDDTDMTEDDIIFYVVAAAVYIMTIHFAIAIKKEFKLNLMVSCFVLGFVVGYFMHSMTAGFVVAIVLSLFLW